MTILDTPETIATARLLILRSGLKLEIKTDMRSTGNRVFNTAKQITGKKTRAACLAVIEKMIEESR